MRAPSVAPREADAVGSLKVCRGGTAIGETHEEGGKLYFRKYIIVFKYDARFNFTHNLQ